MTAANFADAMRRLQWTQAKAARKLETASQKISDYATGQRKVPEAIAAAVIFHLDDIRKDGI